MQNKRQIVAELDFTLTLKTITETYQELSAIKMQKIRNSVLKTRDFLSQISAVYFEVRHSYKRKVEALAKKNKKKIISKGVKKAEILLSTNTKLYGDITKRVFDTYWSQVDKKNGNLYILGKVGYDLFKEKGLKLTINYYDFPETKQALVDLRDFFGKLASFDSIDIYFGKYVNLVNQTPVKINISGESIIEQLSEKQQIDKKFYFEPNLEKIVAFFTNEISGAMMKQSIHESQLAGYAARINTMEEALHNIGDETIRLERDKRKLNALLVNNRQLEKNSRVLL